MQKAQSTRREESQSFSFGYGIPTPVHAEFTKQVGGMALHRDRSNAKSLCDLFIAETLAHQRQHVEFTCGERLNDWLDERRGDLRLT